MNHEGIPKLYDALDLLGGSDATLAQWRCISIGLLDHLPVGIFIVDDAGKVRHANAVACGLLECGDGLTVVNGQISVDRPDDRRLLLDTIRRVIHGPAAARGEAMRLGRTSSLPLQLFVQALRVTCRIPGTDFSPDSHAIVLATDPERPGDRTIAMLRQMFNLTESEAGLVQKLVTGATIDAAARTLGIAVSTARVHLKAVFQKTHTNRQADLVRLVLSAPVCVEPTEMAKSLGSKFAMAIRGTY